MSAPDATSGPDRFAKARAAASAVGFQHFEHVGETGSTNADLAARVRDGEDAASVLVTDHQRAGRGRLDRTWTDIPGSQLLVSFLFAGGFGGSGRPPVDFANAVALSARAAVAPHVQSPVLMKWPNDLVAPEGPRPGKLAGVLGEVAGGDRGAVVVGIGVNVVPVRVEGATSLVELGGDMDRDTLLTALIMKLVPLLDDDDARRAAMVEYSATVGERVRVSRREGDLVGHAVGIDADGCLLVECDGRVEVVAAGDVTRLRPEV